MVQFDTVNSRKLRKANNAKLLHGEACIGLPDQLRETSHHAGQPPTNRRASCRLLHRSGLTKMHEPVQYAMRERALIFLNRLTV